LGQGQPLPQYFFLARCDKQRGSVTATPRAIKNQPAISLIRWISHGSRHHDLGLGDVPGFRYADRREGTKMPPRASHGWSQPPLRVLLIEDNYNDFEIIERVLKGHPERPDVFHARDGEEALDFLYQRGENQGAPRPDFIISCLVLPKIRGYEILARIKADPKLQRIPFVVLTNSEREEDIHRSYTEGAAGFMTKPVDTQAFAAVVRQIYDYWSAAKTPCE
jgi:CheY-like chemotaxis protein